MSDRLRMSVPLRDPLNLWLHRGLDVIGAVPVPRGWSRQQLTNTQPVLCPELGSLQRYTALPEGARRVAEDEHIAGSDYPLPGAMEVRQYAWERQLLHRLGRTRALMRQHWDSLIARAMKTHAQGVDHGTDPSAMVTVLRDEEWPR